MSPTFVVEGPVMMKSPSCWKNAYALLSARYAPASSDLLACAGNRGRIGIRAGGIRRAVDAVRADAADRDVLRFAARAPLRRKARSPDYGRLSRGRRL